ncbi:hypothetical protein [Novosphingobium sp.]|uniref:hypothetical protein n=1 Tax=Novosphingobium sp. TaxID=1874826 RepID=UPI002FDD02C5
MMRTAIAICIFAATAVLIAWFVSIHVALLAPGVALVAATVGLALGLAAAIGHYPGLARVLRLARRPTLRDILVAALCIAPMLSLVVGIALAVGPVTHGPPRPQAPFIMTAGRILLVLGQVLVAAPLLAILAQPAPPARDDRPLWPLVAGIIGGELALLACVGMWNVASGAIPDGTTNWRVQAIVMVPFPPLGLVLGAAVCAWWQALASHRQPAFEWDRLFPAAVKGFLLLVQLALIAAIIRQTAPGAWEAPALATAGTVTCIAWIYGLWRLRSVHAASPLRALVGALVLALAFTLGALLAGGVFAGQDLLTAPSLPVAIVSWLLTVTVVPGLVRRVVA